MIYIVSKETKNKISEYRKGKKHTEETRKKISEANKISCKGRVHSEKTKQKMSKSHTGENHHNWKGGVKKLNIPLYDTYVSQLEPIEQCRKNEQGHLEVKCAYCGKWFVPKIIEIQNRIQIINGNRNYSGEHRLYCSKECKSNCPIYKQKNFPKSYKPSTSREVQPELRKLVFERDKYQCVKCNSILNLHCHHIEGIYHNPIESADMDLCITLCKDCHKEVHKQEDCKYYDMRCE